MNRPVSWTNQSRHFLRCMLKNDMTLHALALLVTAFSAGHQAGIGNYNKGIAFMFFCLLIFAVIVTLTTDWRRKDGN